MKDMLQNKIWFIFKAVVLCLISVCILLVIPFYGKASENIRIVILLPFIYCIGFGLYMFFSRKQSYPDINILILILFAIKLFVLPFITILVNGFDTIGYASNVLDNLPKAVFIQIVEFSAIIFAFALYYLKMDRPVNVRLSVDEDHFKIANVHHFIYLCIFATALILMLVPSFINKYRPLFFLSHDAEVTWKIKSNEAYNTLPRVIYYLCNWLIVLTRLLVPYLIVTKIWYWHKKSGKHLLLSFIVSGSFVVLFLLGLVPDDIAVSLFTAIVLLSLLLFFYEDKRRFTFISGGVLLGIIFFYMFFVKSFAGDFRNTLLSLSGRLNAYFSGVLNVSGALLMNVEDKFQYFCGDILRSLAVFKGFFTSMPMLLEPFNIALGYDVNWFSQILPLESQLYFYFGYIGVFLGTFLYIFLLMKVYRSFIESDNTYKYFCSGIFLLIMVFGIVMYNFSIILDMFMTYVPLLLIYYIFSKKVSK